MGAFHRYRTLNRASFIKKISVMENFFSGAIFSYLLKSLIQKYLLSPPQICADLLFFNDSINTERTVLVPNECIVFLLSALILESAMINLLQRIEYLSVLQVTNTKQYSFLWNEQR